MNLKSFILSVGFHEQRKCVYTKDIDACWKVLCVAQQDRYGCNIALGPYTVDFLQLSKFAAEAFQAPPDEEMGDFQAIFVVPIESIPGTFDRRAVLDALRTADYSKIRQHFYEVVEPFIKNSASYQSCLDLLDSRFKNLPLYPDSRSMMLRLLDRKAEFMRFTDEWINNIQDKNDALGRRYRDYIGRMSSNWV